MPNPLRGNPPHNRSPEPRAQGPNGQLSPDEDLWSHLERAEAAATSLANRFEKSDWIELVAATLIAVATIATAWSAYQSTRWSGAQALATAAVHRARYEALDASQEQMTQLLTDEATWQHYVQAVQAGDRDLAEFWLQHARPEFQPALEAWAATQTGESSSGTTPFDLPQSRYAAKGRALQLQTAAEQHADQAAMDNQRSDNYMLLTVMFALVLFFAGVGPKFKAAWIRRSMAMVAVAVFGVGTTFLLAMPRSVGI